MLKKLLSLCLTSSILLTAFASTIAKAEDAPVIISVEPEAMEFVTTAVGETAGIEPNSSFSGGAWVNKSSATQFSYESEIYSPKSALFTFETYGYQNGNAAWLSEFSVIINGVEYTKADLGTAVDLGNPYPQNTLWKKYSAGVMLNKGKNTVVLKPTTTRKTGEDTPPEYLFAMDCVKFTEVTSTVYRTEWESLPNMNLGLGHSDLCSGEGNNQSILIIDPAPETTAEYNLKVNVPIAGRYKFVISANHPDTNNQNESKYTIAYNENVLNLEILPKTNYYESYGCEVVLPAGESTFVLTGSNRTLSPHVCIYGDFYEVQYLGEVEKASGKIVIEGENPVSATNQTSNVIDHSAILVDDATSGKYANPSLASGSGYIRSAVDDPVNAPSEMTYKATVPADGEYDFAIDLGAHVVGEQYLSPVKLTIKQGSNVLLDNKYVAVEGNNLLICQWDETEQTMMESTEVITSDNATVTNNGVVYYSNGGIAIRRYSLLNKLNLTQGDVDIIFTIDSGRKDIKGGYIILDDIILQKNVDYTAPVIDGIEEMMNTGDTLNLKVVDEYNTPFDENECDISWESSNTNVLTVSDSGVVTALNPGRATVKLTVEYDSIPYEVSKVVTVIDETYKFIVDDVKVNGNNVDVTFVAFKDLSSSPISFIVGRFDDNGLLETSIEEVSTTTPYMYTIKSIPITSSANSIKLFTWTNVDDLVPVYSVIDVE